MILLEEIPNMTKEAMIGMTDKMQPEEQSVQEILDREKIPGEGLAGEPGKKQPELNSLLEVLDNLGISYEDLVAMSIKKSIAKTHEKLVPDPPQGIGMILEQSRLRSLMGIRLKSWA